MTPEQQLRAALEFRASTASPGPGALAEIRGRADRRRWAARLQVGVVAVAVVGIAAGAFALAGGPGRLEPAPPAASQPPVPAPEPSPTAQASPPASPAPSPTATAGAIRQDEFVAVHADRVVVVSATTGAIGRTITTLPRGTDDDDGVSVQLAPDRRSLYLFAAGAGECAGVVDRVDVTTGEREAVVAGVAEVDLSPDGGRLAYLAECAGSRHVVVRDIATGETRQFPHTETEYDAQGNPMPWRVAQVVWHADNRRLWVVVDWENTTQLRLLDPSTDRTTADAERFDTRHVTYHLERRGQDLVFLHRCCYPELTEDSLLVIRTPDGRERELVRSPVRRGLGPARAGSDGDLLYGQGGRAYRLDLETGRRVDLGELELTAFDW